MSILKKIIFVLISCLALYKFINPVAAVEVAQKIWNHFGSEKLQNWQNSLKNIRAISELSSSRPWKATLLISCLPAILSQITLCSGSLHENRPTLHSRRTRPLPKS